MSEEVAGVGDGAREDDSGTIVGRWEEGAVAGPSVNGEEEAGGSHKTEGMGPGPPETGGDRIEGGSRGGLPLEGCHGA